MKIKTLKSYQEQAVASGLGVFLWAKTQYGALPPGAAPEEMKKITAHTGTILLEAPTGSGKTLMAAHLLEEFSRRENVVWFWFAPFKGVTGQTVSFLKEQCGGLRTRDLSQDRQVTGSRRGDVFVTTWQTVAVKVADRRNARKDSEQAPGTDTLVARLREMGFRIGVVVDEAHHSFQGQGQAAAFYNEVLAPEYTVLITATPDDKDIEKWKKSCGVAEVQRISVSRADAVDAGLVKAAVRCISFIPDPASEGLVDMELTCLRCATGVHADIKAQLKTAGISLAPLMLVQVDSKRKDSVAKAKERLMQLGWTEDKIAVHTAEEPDAGLLALANDEQREVLIFKMAVALGFDAPRAFTLVSMRAAKDEDFGVQLLGRILRVHRRLHGKSVPEALRYGYVLLANPDAQTGLEAAGQRMNALKTELAKTAPTVGVVAVAGKSGVQILGPGGQSWMFPPDEAWKPLAGSPGITTPQTSGGKDGGGGQGELPFGLEPETTTAAVPGATGGPSLIAAITGTGPEAPLATGKVVYKLRPDVPRRFKSVMLPPAIEELEEECAKFFMVDAAAILSGMVSKVQVQKRTLEVFTGQMTLDFEQADLSRGEVARRAQDLLFDNDNFDPRELRRHLLIRLKQSLEDQGLAALAKPEEAAHVLNAIILHKPGLLKEAQKKAIAAHATLEETEALPEEIPFDEPVMQSPRNIYHIYPPGMNNWEREFAQALDAVPGSLVRWWHRNEVKRPWSVSLVLPEGGRFFPDFIISIDGRKRDDGILLADPKAMWEQSEQHGKVLTEHPAYGKALIITKAGNYGWHSIVWDAKTRKPALGGAWDWDQAPGW